MNEFLRRRKGMCRARDSADDEKALDACRAQGGEIGCLDSAAHDNGQRAHAVQLHEFAPK